MIFGTVKSQVTFGSEYDVKINGAGRAKGS